MSGYDETNPETYRPTEPSRAADGSSSSIGAGGNTVAAVSSYVPAPVTRIGFLKGMIQVPDDFDTMGRAETRGLFEGGE